MAKNSMHSLLEILGDDYRLIEDDYSSSIERDIDDFHLEIGDAPEGKEHRLFLFRNGSLCDQERSTAADMKKTINRIEKRIQGKKYDLGD